MLADLSKGQVTQSPEGAFELGRNLATTPGKVVFEHGQRTPRTFYERVRLYGPGELWEMLAAAQVSPRPTGQLFERLAKETPQFSAEFLQSHPQSEKRAAHFLAAFDPREAYRPVLSGEQADALFDICRKPAGSSE